MAIRARELSTQEAFEIYFQDLMLERRTAIPASIVSVNTESGGLSTVDVQPSIKQSISSEDGLTTTYASLPLITKVPLILPYSTTSGYSVTIPISVGDECLLLICDRAIDKWQEFGGEQTVVETVTPRAHELTDAVCLVGLFSKQNVINNWSSSSLDIRNGDGTTCISLTDEDIILKTPTSTIEISDGIVEITAAQIQLNGDVTVAGNFSLTGTMTDKNGVDLETHVHSDPQGGETGGPENP